MRGENPDIYRPIRSSISTYTHTYVLIYITMGNFQHVRKLLSILCILQDFGFYYVQVSIIKENFILNRMIISLVKMSSSLTFAFCLQIRTLYVVYLLDYSLRRPRRRLASGDHTSH